VKAVDGADRTLTFTISTAKPDRSGDTIAVEGWVLEAYRRDPVVLWAHDATLLPVARAKKVWIENEKLKSEAEFTPLGMARFNDTVFDMYKQGFLSAVSVGFIPLKWMFTEDPHRKYGIDFKSQELIEWSCCPVPANSEALIEGRSAGIDIGPMLDWAEDAIKRVGGNDRIIKLAESVLGGNGQDLVTLAWAERIIEANGKSLVPAGSVIITRERANAIAALEAAATRKRLADKRQREIDVVRAKAL
jgi:HK97 family phage prohead protease